MSTRAVSLTVLILVSVCAVSVCAQEKLGDLVQQSGYEWVIGRWVATTDEGQKVEVKYDWALDKRVVLSDIAMGEFKYHGMVVFSPDRQEVFDVGTDNRGGTWKGTWYEDGAGLIHKVEHTGANGEVHKGEIVHNRLDTDSMSIAFYAVDSNGVRASEPWGKLTYKRQPAAKAGDGESAGQSSRHTDYQKLGDLVSEAGYEWLIGKWTASLDGRQYTLKTIAILDDHAGVMEVKIDDFQYRGLITFMPAGQEISQTGADNRGGIWKSTWEEGTEGPVHSIEYTSADGTTRKMEHVYIKTDNDAFQVEEYTVESGGYRAAEPRGTLTFKRQESGPTEK